MWWLLACGCLLPIACARAVPTTRRHDVSRSTAATGQAASRPDACQDLSRSASARCQSLLLSLSLSVVQRRGCRSAWAARGCVRRDATRHGMTGKRRDAPRQDRTGHSMAWRGVARHDAKRQGRDRRDRRVARNAATRNFTPTRSSQAAMPPTRAQSGSLAGRTIAARTIDVVTLPPSIHPSIHPSIRPSLFRRSPSFIQKKTRTRQCRLPSMFVSTRTLFMAPEVWDRVSWVLAC